MRHDSVTGERHDPRAPGVVLPALLQLRPLDLVPDRGACHHSDVVGDLGSQRLELRAIHGAHGTSRYGGLVTVTASAVAKGRDHEQDAPDRRHRFHRCGRDHDRRRCRGVLRRPA